MRLQLLSDLHLEFHRDAGESFVRSLDPTGVEVLVLAGDIAVGDGIGPALELFCRRYAGARVVYVHGNHEFYGTDRPTVVAHTEAAVRRHPNLTWLDGTAAELCGRRFLGGTLWFRPGFPPYLARTLSDFSEIQAFESWVYAENARVVAFLERELRAGDVVVTHHLPTQASVATEYAGSPLNAFFVCDVEPLIVARQPVLWLHGHTHASVDARVGATRVLCNPFGYVRHEENRAFDPRCFVELAPASPHPPDGGATTA